MKKLPVWLIALPIIAIAAFLQLTYDWGERGSLHSPLLREVVYPITRSVNGTLTNLKFKLRGPMPPQKKIVIVDADDRSVNILGRWPWHREIYAQIIYSIFKQGAKSVGLDVAFSEKEERIPPELYDLVEKKDKELATVMHDFEGDPTLAKVFSKYRDHLVMGFSSIATCQPGYVKFDGKDPDDCPLHDPELNQAVSSQLDPFAIPTEYPFSQEVMDKTPLVNVVTAFSNIPLLRDAGRFAGSFYINPDPDGYIRRYPLFFFHQKKIYPSLALKMAELDREDEAKVEFSDSGLIKKVYFSKDPEHPIPVTPLGNIDLNFRGPREAFTYVNAIDVLKTQEQPNEEIKKKLEDAIVLFGVSATGIYDMRAFPFDSNVPGVEGHATGIDNLLAGDALRSANNIQLDWLPVILIVVLGFLFAFFFSKFEAIPSLLIFVAFFSIFGWIDIKVLFERNINLPSALLILEIGLIFILILAIRYILEEQNKKFVKQAFSKYLAPQVVDLVLKDPTKLTVGGERRELTILFSDLRGFTTFSEKLDPKTLSQFLNEYLSEMTEIIFEHEGTLDKYIGDAIMAFWGAPLHQTDHAERAWKAAVAMKKKLEEIAPAFKEKYGMEVSAGIGINSGEVSVGNMGSKRIFEYTVIGDHVNLASRLESLTRLYHCDILSTQYTVDKLPEAFKSQAYYRKVDAVVVKGKTLPVDLIQVSEVPIGDEILKSFIEAQTVFKARKWDEAIALFKQTSAMYEALHKTPDPVVEIFIKRCEEFKKNPPPETWDGAIEMRSK